MASPEPYSFIPHPRTEPTISGDTDIFVGVDREPVDMIPPWGIQLLRELYLHDKGSFEHSIRVGEVVHGALREGVLEEPLEGISHEDLVLAGLLHDTGKVVLDPDLVINDTKVYTGEERERLKPHAAHGYSLIEPHNLLVAQLGGGHHLHQKDSYGHEGARNMGPAVVLGQKLIATADVVDALARKRSYHEPRGPEEIRGMMLSDGFLPSRFIDYCLAARFPLQRRSSGNTVFQARA